MMSRPPQPNVIIIGGGLAGLSAAVEASRRGLHVELFEQRRRLGGRSGALWDPLARQLVDYSPHAAMGCCTALANFWRTMGLEGHFSSHKVFHFIDGNGRRHDFAPSRLLPAPTHLLPGLLRLRFLSLRERWGIVRAMRKLAALHRRHGGVQGDDDETIGHWLRQQGQSEKSIGGFWSTVVESALAETVDRASLLDARKVFVEGMMAARHSYELVICRQSLGDMIDRYVAKWLVEQGVALHRGCKVERLQSSSSRVEAVVLGDGTSRAADSFVLAVEWRRLASFLHEDPLVVTPGLQEVKKLQPTPITAVHLWFDRPITPLPHAVFVDRRIQWLFSVGSRSIRHTAAHYYQVLLAPAATSVGRSKSAILEDVVRELKDTWPSVGNAELLHHRVITQPAAVFAALPGVSDFRPAQKLPLENLALAGDWTSTGWPATMESAVRSGYQGIEAIWPT